MKTCTLYKIITIPLVRASKYTGSNWPVLAWAGVPTNGAAWLGCWEAVPSVTLPVSQHTHKILYHISEFMLFH